MVRPLNALSRIALFAILAAPHAAIAAPPSRAYDAEITRRANAGMADVIAWRRDFHEHPELSNRETRTSAAVAEKLKAMGLEVRTGIARTGVVAVLRGGKPGPVVALRSDMDALPVREEVDVPFASKAHTLYNGQDVGVMHACGHDTHMAMLLGAARVLTDMKAQVPGTVLFIFQPAEEGAPAGEEGGASLMIKEGVLRDPHPSAIFGMHVVNWAAGTLTYHPEGAMAASDIVHIIVRGRQTHGGRPWEGIDPVIASAQVITGLQTIISRQIDLTNAPAVLSIGMVHGGIRNNVIPDSVVMEGTLRTFDPAMRDTIMAHIRRTAEDIAASSGARAQVDFTGPNPVVWNDAALTARMAPTLARVVGEKNAYVTPPKTWAEDFSYYAKEVPGLFIDLGINPPGIAQEKTAPNHSPRFYVDESNLVVGVRTWASLALDYLNGGR